METNNVRNCRELGLCLQNIVSRLMANDNLVNLLYYQDKDPLEQPHLTNAQKKAEVFNKRICLIPKVPPQEQAQSTIGVLITSAKQLSDNQEFTDITIQIEIFVPITQWIIKDSNLRPYAIMGEVQDSLNNKVVNGLGRMWGGDFSIDFVSDEMTSFVQTFHIYNYD